jgi:hypothetical protein
MVLTPHLDADYPDDGLKPDDSSIMQSGIFNLGFLGINSSRNTRDFLEWWKRKLYDKCVVDLKAGYFVDQKFIDLALCFFEGIHVEKDTGYNVAYHNLHSRRLSFEGGTWLCNGKPLYFYHFCGFSYSDPAKMCKYYKPNASRYNFGNRPDVAPLYDHYLDRIRANGHELTSRWRYTYGYFNTGEWIQDPLRKEYRDSEELQARCADPFVMESFGRHSSEFKPLRVQTLIQRSYEAMAVGDYRTGMARLREAYAYDRSLLFDPLPWAYSKWAAKLWFLDQSRRLSTSRRSSTLEEGA